MSVSRETVASVNKGEQSAETIGVTAYRRLRRDIIDGELLPGQRLKLESLRERYGVSVSTLREILSQLVSESFVVAEGQRGFEVSPATASDLKEVGDLRLLLENHALALSLKQGDLDWEAGVVAAHHKLSSIEQRLLKGEVEHTQAWIACDFAFHQSLISACNSRSMLALHSTVFDRFLRYHMVARSFRGAGVAEDHDALFRLAMARDVEGAQRMLEKHVSKGIKHILATGALS